MVHRELISEHTLFAEVGPQRLGGGEVLDRVTVAYRTWGRLGPAADNAVLVCHALTGSADVDQWWPGLFGRGRALDPDHDFILASNVLGSCYGTTGPASAGPDGRSWGADFPAIDIRDMVRVQRALAEHLGIRRFRLVVGGSLGGMQALEWLAGEGDLVEAAVVIATAAAHSPWCIALSEAQRAAITADASFADGRYSAAEPPAVGLAAARMMAMCAYRSADSFDLRFARRLGEDGTFDVASYLRHQGSKLVARFDANTYITLTRAMDRHDVGRGRGGVAEALGGIGQPVLVVSISSDVLYPPADQASIVRHLRQPSWVTIGSPHGHDGFLVETEAVNRAVVDFRRGLGQRRARLAS